MSCRAPGSPALDLPVGGCPPVRASPLSRLTRRCAGTAADFVEAALEEIQLDDAGIAAVLPRRPYFVVAALAAGIEMVGETGFEPATS